MNPDVNPDVNDPDEDTPTAAAELAAQNAVGLQDPEATDVDEGPSDPLEPEYDEGELDTDDDITPTEPQDPTEPEEES